MGFHRPSTGRVREKEKMVRNKVKKRLLHICNLPKTIYRRRNIQFITSLSFTLVALVSMLFMGIAFYAQFVRNARQMALENNKQMLEQVSWNLNSYIRKMMNISDFMYYNVIKNKDLTEESIDKEMNLLYEENKDYLVSIVCVTEDGAVLAAGPIATRKKSVDLKEQEWFVQAGEKIENLHFTTPHVQNIFESSNYQYAWVISLSRSVELTNAGHTRRGVLLVDMNYSAIEQVFDKANEQNSGYVYLMDRNGEIIYHPRQKAIYSGMVKENNRMASTYEDGTHIENFMGEERAVVVKTIGYTGWKIVNVTPTSKLFRNAIHIGFFMVMICTVTIFLILFGNIFISDRVTEPLRNLEESIRYLEEGHLDKAKKALRDAGKIDTDNTTTLRYLKEVNRRLKEKGSERKKKNDDLISYQSGNETIIMPKRFRESSMWANILYIIIGLVVGVAVTCFLVVPGIKSQAKTDAKKQLLSANDTISTNGQTISGLNDQIDKLKKELEDEKKKNDGVSDQISTYEALLNAYVYYTSNDVIKAGEALENINTSYLSDSAKQTYDALNGSIADSYKEALYNQAYSSYSSGDYQSAIPTFQKLVGMDEAYRDGSAAYYLAQSFRKSGDLASAKPYYQYVVDNYAGTEKARTSKNYLAQEQ